MTCTICSWSSIGTSPKSCARSCQSSTCALRSGTCQSTSGSADQRPLRFGRFAIVAVSLEKVKAVLAQLGLQGYCLSLVDRVELVRRLQCPVSRITLRSAAVLVAGLLFVRLSGLGRGWLPS